MLQKRKPPKLFSDFNTLQFASVMGLVMFVLLLVFMTDTSPHHYYGTSVDLPKAFHPVSMQGADRDDAMLVAVTRDGKIYFGTDQVAYGALAVKIQDRLEDPGVERKVYIKADTRARYGVVKVVLDGVRSAGILRVAFLVNERRRNAF